MFKCPHCTFWAATASRFHVHIVGHLNRKPFECSCCAYRSNWRWDITKHIRLKSARKLGCDEATASSHQGAKVLMTDETGRRNYSKYNRYLTVMEMDIADGADRAAGGDCEDGKNVASKKVVGGGITRKRRTAAALMGSDGNAKTAAAGQASRVKQPASSKTNDGPARKKAKPVNYHKSQSVEQQQRERRQRKLMMSSASRSSPSPTMASGDNRSKTMWKCKKCFFR